MEEQQEIVKQTKKYSYPNKKHIVINAATRETLKVECKTRGLTFAKLVEEMWQAYLRNKVVKIIEVEGGR